MTGQSGVPQLSLQSTTAATMLAAFEPSGASARPDHKGIPREVEIRAFLRDRLPRKFGVAHGHLIHADRTSPEFDVIVYDALNCPTWAVDPSDDPRLLVPVEAVVGVIEVKSTLTCRALKRACGKLGELDDYLGATGADSSPRPFRFVFAYRLETADPFNGWGSPSVYLSRYAGQVACQPDAVFVLDTHFLLLTSKHSVTKAYALHWGVCPDEVWASSNIEPQLEDERHDFYRDQYGHTLDYCVAPATSGLLLLAFFTFVLEAAERYAPHAVSYTDRFYTWGGGGMVSLRAGPDPDLPTVFLEG